TSRRGLVRTSPRHSGSRSFHCSAKAAMSPRVRFMSRLFNVEPREAPPVAAGLLMFFLLFAGYFMLRPVRETMGIAGGVDNLQWLFTGTFLATLVALPLFGWL